MRMQNHARRIASVECRDAPRAPSWIDELREIDRQDRAVRAITKFAQELAGFPPPPPPVQIETFRIEAPPAPPPPPPPAQRWTKDVRPGPQDVLTWEEAMSVPWYDALAEEQR